jgi:hypothetical protein
MTAILVFLGVVGLGFLAAKDKLGVFLTGLGYLTAAIAILMSLFFGFLYLYTNFVVDLWNSGWQ